MKIKKLACNLLASVFALTFCACAKKTDKTADATPLAWSDGVNDEGRYDNTLFYCNDFESVIVAADPYIVYEDGWFYLYSTETAGGVMVGYRSQNLANWEYLGEIFRRNPRYWANARFWAPKVVKNPADGKFYMYTCCSTDSASVGFPEGTNVNNSSAVKDRLYLTVLVADSPAGPFHEWTGERKNHVNYHHGEIEGVGDEVTLESGPMFDFAQAPAGWATNKEYFETNETNIFAQLDAFPFFDDNGDFYLYFIRSRDMNDEYGKQGVWGVKMLDMVTPDYETLTCITQPGFLSPGGERSPSSIDDSAVNEGCFVQSHTTVKADGSKVTKYYLTYSRSGFGDVNYSSCLAIADSPLGYAKGSAGAPNGGYVKLDPKYGNPYHMINSNYDMYTSTGNAMSFWADGEQFLVSLATVKNKTTPTRTSRNFIIDRVSWAYNDELGYDIPHSNGPTQGSLQPAPSVFSGYKNIASEATVTATNAKDGENAAKLNDGFIAIHERDEAYDFHSAKGGTEITLEFASEREVRAVMVYNTSNVAYAFSSVDYILLETENGNYIARDIEFPKRYLTGDIELGGTIHPGSAALIEFSAMKVKKITIAISQKFSTELESVDEYYAGVAVADIKVLGK